MQQIFYCIRIFFIALALFSLVGGHWMVFQGIAYARMIRSYSAESSWQVAVEKTVSGKYPCALCKKIAAAKKEEKQKESFLEKITKKEKVVLEETRLLSPLFYKVISYSERREDFYRSRLTRPATPPPRVLEV